MAESNNKFSHVLLVRALSGIVLVAVMLAVMFLGGPWWHGFAAVAAMGALREFYSMVPEISLPGKLIGLIGAFLVLVMPDCILQLGVVATFGIICFAVYFSELMYRQKNGESNSLSVVGPVVSGIIYTVVPWLCLVRLRTLPDPMGLPAVLSIFLCTWSCDVMAFLVGSKWGTVHICPHVSPNKSIEGFIGGFVASVLCGGVCALVFRFSPLAFILVGAACGSFGQLGDLVESMIKREHGVKDSGHILPGHGGFLDRFDSVLINALCAWIIWWGILP